MMIKLYRYLIDTKSIEIIYKSIVISDAGGGRVKRGKARRKCKARLWSDEPKIDALINSWFHLQNISIKITICDYKKLANKMPQ